jgi:hypothetical protein
MSWRPIGPGGSDIMLVAPGDLDPREWHALQISLDLCIPEKELAKTRSQISFKYFQSHS